MINDKAISYAGKTGKLIGTMSWVALHDDISNEVFQKLARCLIEISNKSDLLDQQRIGWLNEEAQKRNITLPI